MGCGGSKSYENRDWCEKLKPGVCWAISIVLVAGLGVLIWWSIVTHGFDCGWTSIKQSGCDTFGECGWNYAKGRCSDGCSYQYKFGDMHLGQSCRSQKIKLKAEKKKKTQGSTAAPSTTISPALKAARNTPFGCRTGIVPGTGKKRKKGCRDYCYNWAKKQGDKNKEFPKLPKEAKGPKHDSIQCSSSIGEMNESGSGLCATCTDITQECICTYDGQDGEDLCLRQDTGQHEPWSCGLEDPKDSNCSSSVIDEENTETTDIGHKHCPVFKPKETEGFTSLGFSLFTM